MCQTASHFHRKSEAVCILVTNVTEKNIGKSLPAYNIFMYNVAQEE